MANTTVKGALAIHGQNPQVYIYIFSVLCSVLSIQFLVETVIRNRIWESTYWKEHCFALTGIFTTVTCGRLFIDDMFS